MTVRNVILAVAVVVGFLFWAKAVALGLTWISAADDLLFCGGAIVLVLACAVAIKAAITAMRAIISRIQTTSQGENTSL